jgi:hypothetical protein
MSKIKSKLNEDGCIPAHIVCPFRKPCGDYAKECCEHKGKKHEVPYSCAIARGFDLSQQHDKEQHR